MRLNRQTCLVTEIMPQLVRRYTAKAQEKSIQFHYTGPAEIASASLESPESRVPQGLAVWANYNGIVQVLDNIISNAVKYSPPHKNVWVAVREFSTSLDAHMPLSVVQFVVRDEGPGFTDDDKRRMFGKFARLSARPTGGEHSTGLGLSIAKKIIEAMDGQVWCESEVGNGATFYVELPAAATIALSNEEG
jgi:signal transduction histidine kinase